MHFIFGLALVVPSVLGTVTTSLISSTSTTEICSTRKVSTSVKNVPTNTIHNTAPPIVIVAIVKSTPVHTVTPQISTTTQIITALITTTVTASAITDVFSTTSTVFINATLTQSITSVAVVTLSSSTTIAATTTITTPAGFISIDTSTGEENFGQSPAKRGQNHPHAPRKQQGKGAPPGVKHNGGFCDNDQTYPAAVTCAIIQQIHVTKEIITIFPASTITLPAITTTVLSTTTQTSTSILPPTSISTTLSFSTTSTLTLTSVTTLSSTVTSTVLIQYTSTTSQYAACATPNILGPETSTDTYPYDNYFTDSTASIYSPSANSPYDCCVACISTANCYYSAYAAAYGICNIIVGESCPVGQPIEGCFYTTGAENEFQASYSNGLCGSLGDGGSD